MGFTQVPALNIPIVFLSILLYGRGVFARVGYSYALTQTHFLFLPTHIFIGFRYLPYPQQ